MDERFNNSVILDLRKGELSLENIKQNVDILFSKVALIPGWSFSGSEWASQIKQTMKEEIKRSVVRTLKVKVKNARDEEIIFPIQFPELVDEQFFYIGGLLKVPVFQIVDKPIIYRKLSNGNFLLKLRTNTISLELQKDSKENYSVNLFGKKMLLEDLFCCTHSKAIYENWKLVNSDAIEKCDEDAKLLLEYMEERFYPRWESIKTKDDKSRIIGEYFTNYENEEYSKGTTIINSLIVARELDVYNQQYMTNNTLLLEILQAVIEGYKNDLDVSNKRIRLLEYILNPLMKKLFEMIIAVLKNKDTNFKIHQNIIMENCNVSDIIHFNFVLNPVGEIASLMQCTLTGPNGFKKTNVPMHLRNVDDSQFGYICPVDTPDRDGCGVVLNMVPTVDIKDGEFGERDEEIVTSYPINLTPFLNSDDGIRLQMASNQCKQSIYISGREKPFVKSGVEDCYLDKGTFLGKAKYSGIVVYKDNKILLVKYDTGEFDVFKINYRSLFLNTADIIDSMVNVNDHFKEGDILVQSRFITDGELTIGKNLHTLVMPMLGYNYEDGIIVSESASKSMVSNHFVDLSFEIESGQVLLSLVGNKYHPLPKIGDKLKTGEVYARLKCIDWEDGFEAINREPIEKTAPIDCVVTGIEIYPNQWNKKIEEFNLFINSLVNEQSYKYNELTSILKSSMTDQEIKNFITYNGLSYLNCEKNIGKYSVKNDKINGVLIKINAMFEEAVDAGDKLANRHGNKGVIATVLPDNKMPKLDDGRQVDIVINSLGIISRMNPGQIFEMHCGECLKKLRDKLSTMKEPADEKYLVKILKIIDETPTLWVTRHIFDNYVKNKKDKGKEYAIQEICFIMPPFNCTSANIIKEKLMVELGVKSEFEVEIPDVGKVKNPIAAGYMYWSKLVHRASEKMSARSIGMYSQKTNQPLGGKKRGGGHRLGEMEQWAFVSHGADNFLKDLMTIHSDSPGLKNKLLSSMLNNSTDIIEEELEDKPQAIMLMESYFKQMGLEIETSEE